MYHLRLRRPALQPFEIVVVQERVFFRQNHLRLRGCSRLCLPGHRQLCGLFHSRSTASCVPLLIPAPAFHQSSVSVSTTTSDMINDGLSGIMGLGFASISAIQATPFWQTLLNEGALSSPVFSFYFTRYVDQDPMDTAPGGTLTLGGTDTSLYSGEIEFIGMPSGTTPSYWLQQLQCKPFQCS